MDKAYAEILRCVGMRIRLARTEAMMHQSDLARSIDVTQHSISRWERGVSEPGFVSMCLIANVTQKPLQWFAFSSDAA